MLPVTWNFLMGKIQLGVATLTAVQVISSAPPTKIEAPHTMTVAALTIRQAFQGSPPHSR
jgi:hypothetical protein